MAFISKELSVIAYANGFTLWHYTTTDKDTEGEYFNDASNVMKVGDIIITNIDTKGTPTSVLFLVSSNKDGVVEVNDMTTVGEKQ